MCISLAHGDKLHDDICCCHGCEDYFIFVRLHTSLTSLRTRWGVANVHTVCTACLERFYSDTLLLHARKTQGLMETGQVIEDDRRAQEAEGAVKIRKMEVDFEQFEVNVVENIGGVHVPTRLWNTQRDKLSSFDDPFPCGLILI